MLMWCFFVFFNRVCSILCLHFANAMDTDFAVDRLKPTVVLAVWACWCSWDGSVLRNLCLVAKADLPCFFFFFFNIIMCWILHKAKQIKNRSTRNLTSSSAFVISLFCICIVTSVSFFLALFSLRLSFSSCSFYSRQLYKNTHAHIHSHTTKGLK